MMCRLFSLFLFWFIFFFFNDPATTEIYTSDTLFPYTTLFRSLVVVGVANKWLTVSIPDWYGASHSFTPAVIGTPAPVRSEEHTSELQSLMRISYAVFCLKKKNNNRHSQHTYIPAHDHQNNLINHKTTKNPTQNYPTYITT